MVQTSDIIFFLFLGSSLCILLIGAPVPPLKKKNTLKTTTTTTSTQTAYVPRQDSATTTEGLADYIIVEYCPRFI